MESLWGRAYAAWIAFKTSDRGASLVEYALLVVLIALVAIAGITALGGAINTQLEGAATDVGGAPGG